MSVLIDVAGLSALRAHGNVLIVDCRKDLASPDSGRAAYAAAHVPGAVYADLDSDLSDLSRTGLGRHPLPHAPAFARVLSRWGWTPQRTVVAYDDAGGALAAARLWWMLRLVGSQDVRVLDGGWQAWTAAGQPVASDTPECTPTEVEIRFDERQMLDYDALQAVLDAASIVLLDARAGPRFRGETEPLDRVAGHVPGARNRPFGENLDANGRFKPAAQLAGEFQAMLRGQDPGAVVHMCGSGVTACHNLLAMEHAGLSGARLFAPSWSGWSSDPARPVATGPAD